MKLSRRHFVTGLLSVPVTGIAVAKVPEFTKNVKSAPTSIVSDPTPRKHMLLVCERYDKAVAIHRAMGNPINVRPMGIGSSVCGYGGDLIVVDDLPILYGRDLDWWNQGVLTRRKLNGQIAKYKQEAPVAFDFDRKCGIPGSWDSPTYGRTRLATRFEKSAKLISTPDKIRAKADQILQFAKACHGWVPKYDTNGPLRHGMSYHGDHHLDPVGLNGDRAYSYEGLL